MNRIMWIFVVVLNIFFCTLSLADTYKFDPTHSFILWHINHFGFSNPSGKWMVEGTLMLNEAEPEKSKVSVIIHLADMITGIPKLDEHMSSSSFFDVKKFPIATFTSTHVQVIGKNRALISGLLNLHGMQKNITLMVWLNKLGVSPITQLKTAGFSGQMELKRADFKLDAYTPGLSNLVKIDIEAEAVSEKSI